MRRRQFLARSAQAALGLASASWIPAGARATHAAARQIRWKLEPREWKSLGALDLIPRLGVVMGWANESLIEHGIVFRKGGCCMRAACMPAEACAHYYAMTGDPLTLKAIRAAVGTFREYRHKARGHRVPYARLHTPEREYLIHYESIACHVGRNMRGMRAAAHVLRDEQLLGEVKEELDFWIDCPLAFNRDRHFFDARLYLDENGKAIASERKYTMNMGGSLASAMWLVGNDLGDQRLMSYGEEQILRGLYPWQLDTGYFPYSTCHDVEIVDGIAVTSNAYHSLTLQVICPLLAYDYWRKQPRYVQMMRKGAAYMRDRLTSADGGIAYPEHIARARRETFNRGGGGLEWGMTVNSALVHTMIHKYLGDAEAFSQAAANLLWLHRDIPSDRSILSERGEGAISHNFRLVVLLAYEGMHLRQTESGEVEAVFLA